MTTIETQDTAKLVTGLFMSLDGIVEADEDWQFAYFDDELFAGITAGWARAGAALMGRNSFAGYDRLRHEHPDSPAVHFLDTTPKYVASTTLTEVGWPGTTVLGAELETELARLRSQPGKDILVLGSPTLVRWLLARRLLDALTFTVLPIIVPACGSSRTWSCRPGTWACAWNERGHSRAARSSCAIRSPERAGCRTTVE